MSCKGSITSPSHLPAAQDMTFVAENDCIFSGLLASCSFKAMNVLANVSITSCTQARGNLEWGSGFTVAVGKMYTSYDTSLALP